MGEDINVGTAFDDYTPEQRAEFLAVLNEGLPKTAEEWVEYAAKLSPIEYDQRRDAIAKRLDIRVSTLDE
jgi:hypothetical protein